MNRIFACALSVAICLSAYAGNVVPGCIDADAHNYILTVRPGSAIHANDLSQDQIAAPNSLRKIVYFDGLGRNIGDCTMGTGGAGEDIFQRVSYDLRGLPVRQWLPVAYNSSDGVMPDETSFASDAESFYGDSRPYAETSYEPTAQRRKISATAPGAQWQRHQATTAYSYNTTSGEYALIKLDYTSSAIKNNGCYPAASLRVTEGRDADGRRTIVFENCEGVKLCRRVITDDGTYADTRWVFDKYGDLRLILQPELSQRVTGTLSVNSTDMKRYAYYYTYDTRHRITKYRAPGRDYVYNIYDALGNLVMSQTAEQKAKRQWTYIMYDACDRKAVQGILTTTKSQTALAAMMDTTKLVATRNDSFAGMLYDYAEAPGTFEPYLSWVYDDYSYMENASLPAAPAIASQVKVHSGRGLITGVVQKVDNVLYVKAIAYDEKARPITEYEYDWFGQDYRLSRFMRYDFRGNLIWQCERYEKVAEQTVMETRQVALRHTLDNADRIIRTDYNTDPNISSSQWRVLQKTTYDALGRVAANSVGVETKYTYDISSRLTGIASPVFSQELYYGSTNIPGAKADFSGNIVAMIERRGEASLADTTRYSYDRIGRMTSATGSHLKEAFDFDLNNNIIRIDRSWQGLEAAQTHLSYDGNLVTDVSEYSEDILAGVVPRISKGDYSAAITYDRDGRIIADSTRSIVAVEYETWGGPLPRTIDMGNNQISLRYRPDGILASRQETQRYIELYTDSKGNEKERWRTNIHKRQYRGSFEQDGSTWLYHTGVGYITLADGVVHYYACDYQGSTRAVYTPNVAQIAPLSNDFNVTFPKAYNIEQATDYYPSGLPIDVTADVAGVAAGAVTDRLHIGNKWVNHAGLGWYDNTARYYDALLGRFTGPDPLEYKRPWDSPWAHCGGNPVNNIDPDGRIVIADNWGILGIMQGLSELEASLIEFNEDGKLIFDENLDLEQYSVNFKCLITLAKSTTRYEVEGVDHVYVSGKARNLVGEKRNGTLGITLIPGSECAPSPDDAVHVYTSIFASERTRATNIAHELYGHAYFYEIGKDPYHDYPKLETGFDGVGFTAVFGQPKAELDDWIEIVTNNAALNFNKRFTNKFRP